MPVIGSSRGGYIGLDNSPSADKNAVMIFDMDGTFYMISKSDSPEEADSDDKTEMSIPRTYTFGTRAAVTSTTPKLYRSNIVRAMTVDSTDYYDWGPGYISKHVGAGITSADVFWGNGVSSGTGLNKTITYKPLGQNKVSGHTWYCDVVVNNSLTNYWYNSKLTGFYTKVGTPDPNITHPYVGRRACTLSYGGVTIFETLARIHKHAVFTDLPNLYFKMFANAYDSTTAGWSVEILDRAYNAVGTYTKTDFDLLNDSDLSGTYTLDTSLPHNPSTEGYAKPPDTITVTCTIPTYTSFQFPPSYQFLTFSNNLYACQIPLVK